MIFGVDIGNTNITLGLIDNMKVVRSWRLSTQTPRTTDELYLLFERLLARSTDRKIQHGIVASVVPSLTASVCMAIQKITGDKPLIAEPGIRINMHIHYNRPQDVGADRIVNAVAGKHLFGYPLIIVDIGTATTFCYINANGDYSGGAIFPGIQTLRRSLFKSAALLPDVAFENPGSVIGNTTERSIQSGLFFGYCDMVRGIINRMRKQMRTECKSVVTGGSSKMFCSLIDNIDHCEPDLTLFGLELIYRMNRGSGKESGGILWQRMN